MAPQTRQRILDCALAMFNAQGEPNVTTNHIADELEISPGNLYYHFRNKDDIIEQLFGRFEERIGEAMTVPEGRLPGLEDIWLQMHLVFECIWDNRFLYRDLHDLVSRNRVVETHFMHYPPKQALETPAWEKVREHFVYHSGAAWDAAAGVGRQLARQAGPAADGVGQGDVAAARHPLALALKRADEPALLGEERGGGSQAMGRGGHASRAPSIRRSHRRYTSAGKPIAGAPPCRSPARWVVRWRARTRTASTGPARLRLCQAKEADMARQHVAAVNQLQRTVG